MPELYTMHRKTYDLEQFAPKYTPVQMLEMGVFGRGYFYRAADRDFYMLGEAEELARRDRRPPLYKGNYFGAKAGMSYNDWLERGWIFPEDPLGWFHWYCRYHAGRRHERDDRQRARWISYGERWKRMGRHQEAVSGYVTPVVKQGFLQWSYDADEVLG